MSDLIKAQQVSDSLDCPRASLKPIFQKIPTQLARIGQSLTIRRALPSAERRMIGAWCFFDHFGPLNLKEGDLNIAPHPHMGLQTFTWTLAGEILHRDSIGSKQVIHPGAVNLMTAGSGISHSEESLPNGVLHGVQLWIALPDKERNCEPRFEHYPSMPKVDHDGCRITVLAGEFLNQRAPTRIHSPMVGCDLNALTDVKTTLPLNQHFEYGLLVLTGDVEIEDQSIEESTLLYLGCGRTTLSLKIKKDARVFLIGGEPFKEEILLWWNFVARSKEELIEATKEWENHTRFGHVEGYQGSELHAPKRTW